MTTMLGWHWLAEDRRLQFGTREVVEAGKTYTAIGPLEMCHNGVHACRRVLDALRYARGPVVCRVRLSGEILHDVNKSVGRHRYVLWMVDATTVLHEFALVCAENALGRVTALGRIPDARLFAVLEVKRRWLQGAATDQDLDAARAIARDAARDATMDATRDAAMASMAASTASWTWDVAWAASWAATWDVDLAVDWVAARDTAWAAARDAAWDVAKNAAGTAARPAQNKILEQMLFRIRRTR